MPISDREILDVMEEALTLLGSSDGATVRGAAALQAARKHLTALILYLNGAASAVEDEINIAWSENDPTNLQ